MILKEINMLKVINRFVFIFLCFFYSLITNASEIKNNSTQFLEKDIIEWQLVAIDHLSNKSIEPEIFYNQLKKIKNIIIKSSKDKLIIDETNTVNVYQTPDDLLPNNQLLLKKILKKLNLTYQQQDYQHYTIKTLPTRYDLNQSVVVISNYLFLFTNNEIVLAFKIKQEIQHELAKIDSKLNITHIPLNNRYWSSENELGVFTTISDEYNYFFKGTLEESDLMLLKIKSNKKIKLLLLFSYNENSSSNLSLISLSNDFDVIDRLEIGEIYELEDGGIVTEYSIDANYLITLNKVEHRDNKSPKSVSKTFYKISDKGKFIKVNK